MTESEALDIQNLAQDMIDVARKYAIKYTPEQMFPNVKTAFYTIMASLAVMEKLGEDRNEKTILEGIESIKQEIDLHISNMMKYINAENEGKNNAI